MATTSPPRRRKRVRLEYMETLGFFDTPSTTTSGTQAPIAAPPAVATKTIETNGATVGDHWDTTQIDSQSLREWKPAPTRRGLHRKKSRWPVILTTTMLVAGVVTAGYWLYQRPVVAGDIALATVTAEAVELSHALDSLASYPEELTTGVVDRDSSPSALTFSVNEAARSLFSASAALPGSEGEAHSLAADAATLALDASGDLTDVTAFYMALDPILMAPPLETDSSLVEITSAAEDFGRWRALVDTVAASLPVGVLSDVRADLSTLIGSLDRTQSDYLNALRAEERFEAVGIVEAITADLDSIRVAMKIAVTESAAAISDQIRRSQEKLDQLVG